MGEPDEPINGVPSYAQVVQDGDAHDSKPDFVTDAIGTCTEPPMLNGDSLKTVTTNHTTPHETTEASHTATGLERDDRSFAEAVQDGSANGFPDDKQIKPPRERTVQTGISATGGRTRKGPHDRTGQQRKMDVNYALVGTPMALRGMITGRGARGIRRQASALRRGASRSNADYRL